jgi:RNA polymerase sigma-70 factor (ECF subfamily)
MSRRQAGAELAEIEAVYRADLRRFQRLATAIVGSREAACDVVQDAFARAVHRRREFQRRGSLEGWLWRIVVTTARDRAPRPQAVPYDDQDDAQPTAADDERAEVRAAIARLPERQRLALFLRYYADLDYGAIAEALEIRAGTVGALLNQARGNLRRTLVEVPR